MRTSDIVRQLWCEFYSRHCEGWVSWFGAKQDMCAAVKNRRVIQRGETMPCLTGAGATTECLCKAGEFVVVVWSWWRGQGGMRSRRRKKIWSFGCGKPEFVRPQKQALYYPKSLGYLLMRSRCWQRS